MSERIGKIIGTLIGSTSFITLILLGIVTFKWEWLKVVYILINAILIVLNLVAASQRD